jgi:hypothetical protein
MGALHAGALRDVEMSQNGRGYANNDSGGGGYF